MKTKSPLSIQVKVYAPFKIYFDGPAVSVSAVNATGPFDILPRHKNFISLLKPGPLVVRRLKQASFEMHIDRGVIHVRADKVSVFLDV